ncbi:alanine racemase [soil metagenome]
MQHNLQLVRKLAPAARVWGVVKANAYGHGLARGMRGFGAADGLGLIELDAAVRLRELGWEKPILLLEGFFEAADLAVVQGHRLEVTIHSSAQIDMLAKSAPASAFDVHLKLNSGMNRLGFKPEEFSAAHARLRSLPAVRKISLMTHFANAEESSNPHVPWQKQLGQFNLTTAGIEGDRSLSNSAAILMHPEATMDWVRPGIMLYGGTVCSKSAEEFGMKPAMTLSSELIGIQEIASGDAVGYGSRFVASQTMKVGVVACGYADGYPRHAPIGTPILVDGVTTRIVGNVSMDMITVDLSPVPAARIGSTVTLWGEGLPIDEVARAAGTVGYELMCALAPRVRIVEA